MGGDMNARISSLNARGMKHLGSPYQTDGATLGAMAAWALDEATRLVAHAEQGCSLPLDPRLAGYLRRQAPWSACGAAVTALAESLETFLAA
jgi:hypothetical protein